VTLTLLPDGHADVFEAAAPGNQGVPATEATDPLVAALAALVAYQVARRTTTDVACYAQDLMAQEAA
jgi:hypothetical protein